MNLIDRVHLLFAKLGISPKVGDPLIFAVVIAVFNLLVYGHMDVQGLKLAVGLFLLGLVGVAAPPAAGVKQQDVEALAHKLGKRHGVH